MNKSGRRVLDAVAGRLGDFKRERALLSKNTGDPTVSSLRDKKENCSTRRGLRVNTRFVSF